MRNAGFNSDFIHLKEGRSRINVKLKHGNETEINGMGPVVDALVDEAAISEAFRFERVFLSILNIFP